MTLTIETLATAIGIVVSLGTTFIAYGVLTEKVRRLDKTCDQEMREIRENQKEYVTYKHLEAVIEPLREDLKEILRLMNSNK